MSKKIICSECGATIILDQGRETCSYCGSLLDLTNATEAVLESDVQTAACDAVSFKNALIAEVNGQKASIADMWSSLISNPKLPKDKLFNFYKVLKVKIRFCINAYQNMSDDVKYELGDFVCEQMESMINFRIKNNINYIEEADEIQNLIRKQRYDLKARGIFQIKAKIVIRKRIKRIQARDAVLYYNYALQSINQINANYNSKIEPIKTELNATAMTAFQRRKTLKEKIASLEQEKQYEINQYNMKQATKKYNRFVRKYKINNTPVFEEIKEYVPVQRNAEKKEEAKINYTAMPVSDLVDALNASLSKLAKGATRTEIETAKTIKDALIAQSANLNSEAQLYLNSVMMLVNQIFANDQPTVIEAMVKNVIGTVASQSATLKSNLNKA